MVGETLNVNNLTVAYADGHVAADGVSFALGYGENAALIGANGAGKSSLLLALVGVLPAKSGEIRAGDLILGKKTLRELRSRVGLVFQNPDDQLFMPSIFEDVAFGPRSFGLGEAETAERAEAVLARLGISELRDRSPLKLSGGEKRLCAIAAVLATEPEFLLFDEPTAFLDPRAKRGLARTLSELPQGKLIATHDLPFAAETCSRVLLLKNGRLAASGGAELLRDAELLERAGL
ncbi:MAG: energy-coupling factor ABC transporter ATP-binding protein [Oscillospiraceae bacterium]|nr:energy-coupling factor ABC transporter ATP-binding protein [Oscillospiraceae bacterium]